MSAFIDADDPVRVLTNTHVLEFSPECQVYKEHRATDGEIQQLCSGKFRSFGLKVRTMALLRARHHRGLTRQAPARSEVFRTVV